MIKSQHPFFFPTILLIASIGYFATDLYLPSFLAIQEEFDATKSSVKLSLSLYLAGWALSQLFYGPLSDQQGRKQTILLSILIGFFGTLICFFSSNIWMLILGRLIQGLGLGGTSTLFRAILRDVYSGDELIHYGSFIAMTNAICMGVAPALGGYIQNFIGWRFCFFTLIVYLIILSFSVFFFIPETNQTLNPLALKKKFFFTNYLKIFKNPLFLAYTLISSFTLGGLSAYLTASPFLFVQILKFTPIQYGYLAWVIGGSFGLGGLCNYFLIKKIGRHKSLVIGIGAICLSGFSMLFLALLGFFNPFVIIFPMGIFSLGAAISFSNSFAAAFQSFPKRAGSVAALYGCIQVLGGSLISALMSVIQENSQIPLAILLSLIGILSYLYQYWAFSHARKNPPPL